MDGRLEEQAVYARLGWAWSWRGIDVSALLMGVAPGSIFFVLAILADIGLSVPLFIIVAGMFFCGALQYRRKENLLVGVLRSYSMPNHLVPRIMHRDTPPFPVSRELLQ